jgi:hypothetical protein
MVKGWIIVTSIVLSVCVGAYKGIEYADKHTEADDGCYQLAQEVASNKQVQFDMSDGFLSSWECDYDVKTAYEHQEHDKQVDEFMRAAQGNGSQ